jgi:DNA-binding response OmpR family regulator
MANYDILLIGDGNNLQKTIGWVLEYKGFSVKTTQNPEAALEALVRKNYDLVVARITSNDLEGVEILRRAKRLNPAVKLMVVSGNNDAIFPLEAYEVEIEDYILMPVSPAELWRRVSHCLEDRQVIDIQPLPVQTQVSAGGQKFGPEAMLLLHDLRESIVSVSGSLKLMARGSYGEVEEHIKAKIKEVNQRLQKVVGLSEDFISTVMGDPHSRGAQEEVVDLRAEVVDSILAELSAELKENKVRMVNRLNRKGKIAVKGNKLWLQCVFRNLVNNCINHGGRGCTIVVDFEKDKVGGRLNVYNSGKIVPESLRAMLFSYGGRTRQPKAGRRGLEVGLSLSRDLIQNQGGDLWYEPKSDGSQFVMALP